jgi:cholest-4-en-3-one 26-monooxygenase
VICELVGAPLADRERLYELSKRVIGVDDPEVGSLSDGMQAVAEMCAYARELAARRREQPADDIITKLRRSNQVMPSL